MFSFRFASCLSAELAAPAISRVAPASARLRCPALFCLLTALSAHASHIHLYIVVLYVIRAAPVACPAAPRAESRDAVPPPEPARGPPLRNAVHCMYMVYVYGCICVFSPGTQKYTETQVKGSFPCVYWSWRLGHAGPPCWNSFSPPGTSVPPKSGAFTLHRHKIHTRWPLITAACLPPELSGRAARTVGRGD